MARLRKPSTNEPTIFAPSTNTRISRSSPRKGAPRHTSSEEDENSLLEPRSSRKLRYTGSSSHEEAGPALIPKSARPAEALTPRKQRVLRSVESNSRLLRKLSNQSLASPEKRQRERRDRNGTTDPNSGRRGELLYSQTLVKSVIERQAQKHENTETGIATDVQAPKFPQDDTLRVEQVPEIEVLDDEETSMWCGEEGTLAPDQPYLAATTPEDEEDEDEDPVIPQNQRRRHVQSRRVVSDSEDEDDEALVKVAVESLPQSKAERKPIASAFPILTSTRPPHRKGHSTISNWAQDVIDLTSSPEPPASFVLPPPTHVRTTSFAASRPTSSASDEARAILTYSPTPTKKRSPCKAPPISRPSTPPLAPPSPTKLVSPSKKKPAIPKAAHLDSRPSLDAFWNPTEVNEWNELHSPAKPLVSPKKQKWREDIAKMMDGMALEDSSDEDNSGPTTSPKKKSSARSPAKKPALPSDPSTPSVAEIRAARKAFSSQKHSLAATFLTSLDNTMCSGQISALSASTGGIHLVWSRTLQTTAGRATWRREQIRLRSDPSPACSTRTEIRHHCTIELAEKVIDDPSRLYNVLAHEFCHLATFMLSNVRNAPHGPAFKAWGARATAAFLHLGVQVTTTHAYAIDYKYIWECVLCGYAFKRQSRSVDPDRHSCGKCKGRLVQVKPVPRAGKAKDGAEMGGYQAFVKQHFARVKGELEREGGGSVQMGRVMEVVAREYRESKGKREMAAKKEEKAVIDVEALDEVGFALEGLKI
ncbi:hypothetical protein ACN47E_001487 [Coniothyrium glycines]